MAFAQFPLSGGATFPLAAPDGSAAAPSYNFSSQSGSGMYWTGGSLRLSSGGVEVYRTTSLETIYFTRQRYNVTDVATATTITQLSSATSIINMTGSTATAVLGIAPASGGGGFITVINSSSATVTFNNQDVGATASDRIITFSGTNRAVAANAAAHFVYDATASRWRLIFVSA
jgi:hypothetical protein